MSSPASIKIIEIHAFRWTRTKEGKDILDKGIFERLRLGHVGIRVIGENIVDSENIYSFRPKKPGDMSRGEFMERINNGEPFAGLVLREGDNLLFDIAKKYCGKPNIRRSSLDNDSCLEIKRGLDGDIANSPLENKRYSLPPRDRGGKWHPFSFNCATYLDTLSKVNINPYPSGWLGDYLKEGQYESTIYRCS